MTGDARSQTPHEFFSQPSSHPLPLVGFCGSAGFAPAGGLGLGRGPGQARCSADQNACASGFGGRSSAATTTATTTTAGTSNRSQERSRATNGRCAAAASPPACGASGRDRFTKPCGHHTDSARRADARAARGGGRSACCCHAACACGAARNWSGMSAPSQTRHA